MRRAALGLANTLIKAGLRADLRQLFQLAIEEFHEMSRGSADDFPAWVKHRGAGQQAADAAPLVRELVDFVRARFRASMVGQGCSGDLIDAVLAVSSPDPVVLYQKVQAIRGISGTEDFLPIMHTFKRVLNISRGQEEPTPDPASFTEPMEHELFEALAAVEGSVSIAVDALDFPLALDQILTLQAPVAHFFDHVLVDAPDPAVKAVRMGLLLRVARVFLQMADFSRISTR